MKRKNKMTIKKTIKSKKTKKNKGIKKVKIKNLTIKNTQDLQNLLNVQHIQEIENIQNDKNSKKDIINKNKNVLLLTPKISYKLSTNKKNKIKNRKPTPFYNL